MAKTLRYQSLALPLQSSSSASAAYWGWQQQTPPLPIVNRCKPKSSEAIPVYPYAQISTPTFGWTCESRLPPPKIKPSKAEHFQPTYPYTTPEQPPWGWTVHTETGIVNRCKPKGSEAVPVYPYSSSPVPLSPWGWTVEPGITKTKDTRRPTHIEFIPIYPYATQYATVIWGWTVYADTLQLQKPALRKNVQYEEKPRGLPPLPPWGWVCYSQPTPVAKKIYNQQTVTPLTALTLKQSLSDDWGWVAYSSPTLKRLSKRNILEETRPPSPSKVTNVGLTSYSEKPPTKKAQTQTYLVTPFGPTKPITGFVSIYPQLLQKIRRGMSFETLPIFPQPIVWGWCQSNENPPKRKKHSAIYDLITPARPVISDSTGPIGFVSDGGFIPRTRRFVPEKTPVLTSPVFQWVFVPSGWNTQQTIKIVGRTLPNAGFGWSPTAVYTTDIEYFTFRTFWTDERNGSMFTFPRQDEEV